MAGCSKCGGKLISDPTNNDFGLAWLRCTTIDCQHPTPDIKDNIQTVTRLPVRFGVVTHTNPESGAQTDDSPSEAPKPKRRMAPLPTPVDLTQELTEIESHLEASLLDAIQVVQRAVMDGTRADKVKLHAAIWLIEDRRAYREKMKLELQQEQDEQNEISQLAAALRLV